MLASGWVTTGPKAARFEAACPKGVRRVLLAMALASLAAVLLNPIFVTPFPVLLGRMLVIALLLLLVFTAAGFWSVGWLPRWLPTLPRTPRRIVFRRTSTQWGSLAPDGTLGMLQSIFPVETPVAAVPGGFATVQNDFGSQIMTLQRYDTTGAEIGIDTIPAYPMIGSQPKPLPVAVR